MTQDEIIEITKQAGGFSPTPEFLEAFAKMVAAKEREACAKVCDTEWDGDSDTYEYAEASNECAAAIRARG